MVYIYILICLLSTLLSVRSYKRLLNPISIYSLIWMTTTFLYEVKLIKFESLSNNTWLVIFVFHITYTLFSLMGKYKIKKGKYINNNKKDEKKVLSVIRALTIIGTIFTLYNISKYTEIFGYNLLSKMNELYRLRLENPGAIKTIPYVTSVLYIALILSGVYSLKYKFKYWFVIIFTVLFLNELTSGGRVSFVVVPLLFFGVYIIKKINIKYLFSTIILVIIVGTTFVLISSNRAFGDSNLYASDFLIRITKDNQSIYKAVEYILSPLATLNEFMKNPTFNFGGNSLLPLYSVLNKMGFDFKIQLYQDVYYVPMPVNVGTYIRELIQDFGMILSPIAIAILSYFFSYHYDKSIRKNSYTSMYLTSIMFQVIVFTFFDWRIRSSVQWIMIILGMIVTLYIDKNNNKMEEYHEKNNGSIWNKTRGN